jgi:hypothetical protein
MKSWVFFKTNVHMEFYAKIGLGKFEFKYNKMCLWLPTKNI